MRPLHELTCLPSAPPRPGRGVPAHLYRLLGARVLVTRETGEYAFLSRAEHESWLAGKLDEGGPLAARLRLDGFLPGGLGAESEARRQWLAGAAWWRGPARHVLRLGRGGRVMNLENLRRAVDFAFYSPARTLALVLEDQGEPTAHLAWFASRYARARASWQGRDLALVLRSPAGLAGARAEPLRSDGVLAEAVVRVRGAPGPGDLPPRGSDRALLAVTRGAAGARRWVDGLAERGVRTLRVEPDRELRHAVDRARFARFYAEALDRSIELARSGTEISEDWAAAALSRASGASVRTDLLGGLCYSTDGGVFTSEAAADLGREGPFFLGKLSSIRYRDLAALAGARVALAAAQGHSQPYCLHCAYRPFCAVFPALNLRDQGTPWGRLPESPWCALQMAALDVLFARLADDEARGVLEGWGGRYRLALEGGQAADKP